MSILYKVLESQVKKYGLTESMTERIEILYAAGKITTDDYKKLNYVSNSKETETEETADSTSDTTETA